MECPLSGRYVLQLIRLSKQLRECFAAVVVCSRLAFESSELLRLLDHGSSWLCKIVGARAI